MLFTICDKSKIKHYSSGYILIVTFHEKTGPNSSLLQPYQNQQLDSPAIWSLSQYDGFHSIVCKTELRYLNYPAILHPYSIYLFSLSESKELLLQRLIREYLIQVYGKGERESKRESNKP